MMSTSLFLRTAFLAVGTSAALLMSGTAAVAAAPTPAMTAVHAASAEHQRAVPRIAQSWAAAWNAGDGAKLGSLFTADGVYTDHAFDASFTGPQGVAEWVTITGQSIRDARINLRCAFRYGTTVIILSTFSGHIIGAPTAFTVTMTTVQRLRGDKIASNDDYYDIAAVKRQSGLPADFDFTA